MTKINIAIIGYNESLNLPRLFESFHHFDNKCEISIFYADQSSTDNSVEIAQKYGAKIFIRSNKGYADPDKKWLVQEILPKHEYCLLLDADEVINAMLANEIAELEDKDAIIAIPVEIYFLGKIIQRPYQVRLFRPDDIMLNETIHSFIKTGYTKKFITPILNDDINMYGETISKTIAKINRYTDKEVRLDSQYLTIIKMFYMPVVWFFGWGIKNRNFFRGIPGWIHAILMGYYQFILYAKLYEKSLTKRLGSK